MEIERFICNMFQENCYVVSDETKECVIIDCGAFYEEEKTAIKNYISEKQLTPKHLLCTHAHIDHTFGNRAISDAYGLSPEVGLKDKDLMDELKAQAIILAGVTLTEEQPQVKRYFKENDSISFGNHSFEVIPTPGHTPGGVIFYSEKEKVAFTGDTLFKMSIGRTDFEGGSYEELMESLKIIAKRLPPEAIILSGHGPSTTLEEELKFNPYFDFYR